MSGKNKKKKVPSIEKEPSPSKTVKFATDPDVRGKPISWRFSSVDRGGPYSWAALEDPATYKAVIQKLSEIETLSETDLRQQGSHPIELHKLSGEAQQRLREIHHDDIDSIFSIRLMGAVRVHCIHHLNVMRVLWYDPEHQVCPAPLKNT
ncbi:hypothetical protein FHT87_004783 [Rhizobium sp. BK316]|uniref:hypothetical protein n=1 Tax=Rhizobium sp. BK316 TaxID=2587053 RepID=UPI00162000C8|nr:hypothetical protein [Rhizobium sp. BK316]MBB3410836.1 hypothetical protein [Rhizobium sp. BK316]